MGKSSPLIPEVFKNKKTGRLVTPKSQVDASRLLRMPDLFELVEGEQLEAREGQELASTGPVEEVVVLLTPDVEEE